jgi:hypothetical protein
LQGINFPAAVLAGAGTGGGAGAGIGMGTSKTVWHFGHFVFLPAKSSFTEKAFAHPGQVKAITMLPL